jgi:hypothetical protein
MMQGFLPVALLDMIEKGTWAGDGSLMLENLVVKPSADEIAQNHCFLKPLVIYSPAKAWIQLTKKNKMISAISLESGLESLPQSFCYPSPFSCFPLFDGTCRYHRPFLSAMPLYTLTSS